MPRASRTDSMRIVMLSLLLALAACAAPRALNPDGDRAYEVAVAKVDGRLAISWHGGRQQRDAIFIRYLDMKAHPLGPPLQLTDATRNAFEPSLQQIEGDALVAWYEQDEQRHQVALLARFDLQGRQVWRRQLSIEGNNGRNPVVRTAGDMIHVAWIEQGGAEPMLRVGRLDARGQWQSPPRDVATASRNTWNLNAAVGADGTFHVVYDATRGAANELQWLRVAPDGGVHPLQLSPTDGLDSVYPDIALQGTRIALTWFDYRDGNAEVYLRCLDLDSSAGTPTDRGEQRITHSPGESIGAYLTWYRGHIELAWSDADATSQRLYLQPFDQDCHPLGEARALSAADGVAGIPAWASGDWGMALAWNERVGDVDFVHTHGHSREYASRAMLRTW